MKSHTAAETSLTHEGLLFLRRWLAHPGKVGALFPSSAALAQLIARQVATLGPDEALVELGAGTGAVTKALLAAGIPADRLFVIEIDADMCVFLRKQIPHVQVIHGDAGMLSELIPARWHGKIPTIVSGIPMVMLPVHVQQKLIKAWFSIMKSDGNVLQFTYSLVSPIPQDKHGLKGRRKGIAMLNMPPASVWSYEQVPAPVGAEAEKPAA